MKNSKEIESVKNTAKRVIHLYLLGRNDMIYTQLSLDYQTLYALMRSHSCRLVKIPRFPQKLRFMSMRGMKNSENISQATPKPLFFKTDLSDLEEEFGRGKDLSQWALGALHTDSWTSAQKNFFVLVGNKKKPPVPKKGAEKHWRLKKETMLRQLLNTTEKKRDKVTRERELTFSELDLSEDLEGIKQWRDILDNNEHKSYQVNRVIHNPTG